MSRGLALFALATALLALGCENGHTVVVQLQTDLVPGLEFDEVFVQATGLRSRRASLRDDYGRPVELAELRGIATGTNLAVEVSLRRDGVEIVSRRVQRNVRADALLGVIITRNCLEIACPAPGAPTATECRDGVCVTPDCEDEGSCIAPECVRDSECTSSIACVVPRCALGVCLETPDATRCRSDEVCSPLVGCVPATVPDAGPLDAAGPVDAFTPVDAATALPDAVVPTPPFTVYRLPRGASEWATRNVSGDWPTDEIEAAFAPQGSGVMLVMTHTELFVLDLATYTFIDRVARDSVFPELSGIRVAAATAVRTDVFVTAHDTWIYAWDASTRSATFTRFVRYEELGADWRGPLTPPWHSVYGMFYAPDNADGWATNLDERLMCPSSSVVDHLGYLSTDGFGPRGMITTVYDGACLQFVDQSLYGTPGYSAFTFPGAPPEPFEIDAIEYASGLWVFTSPE
ncbi:MAG: hypothetical protein J0L92_04770 [Deltaproteobacteria bacterium]|nr:hypothetical protein [Deltaproteobacteria bacterium]